MTTARKPHSTLSAEEIEIEAAEYAQIQQSEIAATDDYNLMALKDEKLSEEMRLLQLEQRAEEAQQKLRPKF